LCAIAKGGVFVISGTLVFDGVEISIVLAETISHFPSLLSSPSTNLFSSKKCSWNADGSLSEKATGAIFTALFDV